VRALRERDERAFESLLDRYYSPMLRLARAYVRSREEAEEVVQDTWLAVLAGLDRFEGRSSLKTWIFNILVNRARSRAKREARLVPFSSFPRASGPADGEGALPVADRLLRRDPGLSSRWHGKGWEPAGPEERLLATELHARIDAAISALPPRQQEVITLRDLDGWTSEEVCGALEISEANQRVLLHRARVKVRDALEAYLAPPDVGGTPAATCLA
jgi:RNA polymerase sigma-70 factor (ECF subfamily)